MGGFGGIPGGLGGSACVRRLMGIPGVCVRGSLGGPQVLSGGVCMCGEVYGEVTRGLWGGVGGSQGVCAGGV